MASGSARAAGTAGGNLNVNAWQVDANGVITAMGAVSQVGLEITA